MDSSDRYSPELEDQVVGLAMAMRALHFSYPGDWEKFNYRRIGVAFKLHRCKQKSCESEVEGDFESQWIVGSSFLGSDGMRSAARTAALLCRMARVPRLDCEYRVELVHMTIGDSPDEKENDCGEESHVDIGEVLLLVSAVGLGAHLDVDHYDNFDHGLVEEKDTSPGFFRRTSMREILGEKISDSVLCCLMKDDGLERPLLSSYVRSMKFQESGYDLERGAKSLLQIKGWPKFINQDISSMEADGECFNLREVYRLYFHAVFGIGVSWPWVSGNYEGAGVQIHEDRDDSTDMDRVVLGARIEPRSGWGCDALELALLSAYSTAELVPYSAEEMAGDKTSEPVSYPQDRLGRIRGVAVASLDDGNTVPLRTLQLLEDMTRDQRYDGGVLLHSLKLNTPKVGLGLTDSLTDMIREVEIFRFKSARNLESMARVCFNST